MDASSHTAAGPISPRVPIDVSSSGVRPAVGTGVPARAGRRAARAVPWGGVTVAATGAAGCLHLAAAATQSSSGDLVVGFFGLTGFAQLATAVALFVVLTGG